MGRVCDSMSLFIANAEEKCQGELYTYLCAGMGIVKGDTSKAVYLRSKFEEDMDDPPTKEQSSVLKLLQDLISFVQKYPEAEVHAKTVIELGNVLAEAQDEEAQIVHRLPEDFVEQCMHRAIPAVGLEVPGVYYKDGVLLSEQGLPQDDQVWTTTGCMNLYSWKVFNDFVKHCDVASQMTSAFSGLTKESGKYTLEDFKRAIAMIKEQGGQIAPGMSVVLRKSAEPLKTTKVSMYGQTKVVKFGSRQVGKCTFTEPVSGKDVLVMVVNLCA